MSVYLLTGCGLNLANWNLLRKLCEPILGHGLPFVVGGDFKIKPEEIIECNIFEQVGGTVVADLDGQGTCRGRGGSWSNIDFL